MLKKKRAQSTMEYAVLIAVVVVALLAIQIYMKRGISGKLRDSSDQIGGQFEANATRVESHKRVSGTTVQVVEAGTSTVAKGGQTVTYMGGTPYAGNASGTAESRTEWGSEIVSSWSEQSNQ